jgi:hypothetical protein
MLQAAKWCRSSEKLACVQGPFPARSDQQAQGFTQPSRVLRSGMVNCLDSDMFPTGQASQGSPLVNATLCPVTSVITL